MKRLLVSFLICSLVVTGLKAQQDSKDSLPNTIISFCPIGLLNKTRLQFETVISKNATLGITATYYDLASFYRGFKFEPFIRYYFTGHAPGGLFGQANMALGQLYETEFSSNIPVYGGTTETIKSIGYGGNLGYQWLLGNRHNFSICLSVGLQYFPYNKDHDHSFWYLSGPGAIFTPKFSIGCAF